MNASFASTAEEIGAATTAISQDVSNVLGRAFLGYAIIRIGLVELSHGSVTDRVVAEEHVTNLVKSFTLKGRQHCQNPMILLTPRDGFEFVKGTKLSTSPSDESPEIKFKNGDGSVAVRKCLAGQHREAAVKRIIATFENDLRKLTKRGASKDLITAKETEIADARIWAVGLYDEGEYATGSLTCYSCCLIQYSFLLATLNDCDVATTAAAHSLASNQSLAHYTATGLEVWRLAMRWVDGHRSDSAVAELADGECVNHPDVRNVFRHVAIRTPLTAVLSFPLFHRPDAIPWKALGTALGTAHGEVNETHPCFPCLHYRIAH